METIDHELGEDEYRPDRDDELIDAPMSFCESLFNPDRFGGLHETNRASRSDILQVFRDFNQYARYFRRKFYEHYGVNVRIESMDDVGFKPVRIDEADEFIDDEQLKAAALAYHASSPWDFHPNEFSKMRCVFIPITRTGYENQSYFNYQGLVVSFVMHGTINGGEEILTHAWTARNFRRKGYATNLAQSLMEDGITRLVDNRLSELGEDFVDSLDLERLPED